MVDRALDRVDTAGRATPRRQAWWSRHPLSQLRLREEPRGGFLGGSQAQEESLARSSGLYPSSMSQRGYYEANRSCGTALYTDHMILRPDVPFFGDDDGRLPASPYSLGVLTAPAVTARAVVANERSRVPLIAPTMISRIEKLLRVATANGYRRLVLGAWGCGVFGNVPDRVAGYFSEALSRPELFAGVFESVTFAIPDETPKQRTIGPFRRRLTTASNARN